MRPNPTLREHIRAQAENRPGVYRMYGPGDELLYVGKSVHLRTRLLSYFRASKGEKAWELISEAGRVSWEYVPNEFAALIHEMKLIQKWQPRFNVQHKRKRIYAFVKVTREQAPRMLPVTRIAEDGATYYGPFPRVGALARTIRELAHVLRLRDCPSTTPVFFDDQLEIFSGGRMPRCIRADLDSCLAPCCGRPTAAEYRQAVDVARRFLEGRAEQPLRELEQQMGAAAARMDFEYAAATAGSPRAAQALPGRAARFSRTRRGPDVHLSRPGLPWRRPHLPDEARPDSQGSPLSQRSACTGAARAPDRRGLRRDRSRALRTRARGSRRDPARRSVVPHEPA